MVDTLQPREYFPISRLLPDPSDSNTYYLQAIVRNATSGATIDTVNLITQGSRLYAAAWQTPADPSGRGLFITITTSVYTDSGYTTKSEVYGEESDTFVVFDRFNSLQLLATQISAIVGSENEIDYKRIKKMIDVLYDKISDRLTKIESKEGPKPVNLKPVLESLDVLRSAIKAIDIPPPADPVDVGPLMESLSAGVSDLKAAISDIKIPDPADPVDLAPVVDRLDAVEKTRSEEMQKVASLVEELRPTIDVIKKFADAAGMFVSFANNVKKTEEPEKKQADKPKKEVSEINRFGRVVKRMT